MMNTSNTFYGSGNSMSNMREVQSDTTTKSYLGSILTKDYAKPLKQRKCKICRNLFTKTKPFQSVCGIDCSIAVALKTRDKIVKAQDKVKREKLKSRSDWIKEAQTATNRFVRNRDIALGYGCISCGSPFRGVYGGAFDAGHFRSTGSAPHLRFFTKQIALQCVKCNRHLGGNAVEMRKGLVNRLGLREVELIESMQGEGRWSIDYLKRLKQVMNKRANRLEKRIAAYY
jgi:hypothetical protein